MEGDGSDSYKNSDMDVLSIIQSRLRASRLRLERAEAQSSANSQKTSKKKRRKQIKMPSDKVHEIRFPCLSVDGKEASRVTSLACTRIHILGSGKAARLSGAYTHRDEAVASLPPSFWPQKKRIAAVPHLASPQSSKQTSAAPTASPAERYLTTLLTLYTTQCSLMPHIQTHTLIALRQTSRHLRSHLDRIPSLWRCIDLSSSYQKHDYNGTEFSTPKQSPDRLQSHWTNILSNHIPTSPISAYHHIKVLILDDYRSPSAYYSSPSLSNDDDAPSSNTGAKHGMTYYSVQALFKAYLSSTCPRQTLKMLSIRGWAGVSFDHLLEVLRDLEGEMFGRFRMDKGWKVRKTVSENSYKGDGLSYNGEDLIAQTLEVKNSSGQLIPESEWKKERGFALEVLRVSNPYLYHSSAEGSGDPYRKISKEELTAVGIEADRASYLDRPRLQVTVQVDTNIPVGQENWSSDPVSEVVGFQAQYFRLPIIQQSFTITGRMMSALGTARRLGIQLDVGFCRNWVVHGKAIEEAKMMQFYGPFTGRHVPLVGLCEIRWERCEGGGKKGCRWEGWVDCCMGCRVDGVGMCGGCGEKTC